MYAVYYTTVTSKVFSKKVRMMKYLVCISALVVVALTESTDPHGIAAVHKKCQEDPALHVDDTVFEKLKKQEPVDLPENFGKHMVCMGKGLNMINELGKVNVEGLKTHIRHVISKEDVVEKIAKKCAVDEDTAEKTAVAVNKCMYKHNVFGDHDHAHVHHHSHESSESESDEGHHGHHHGH